MDTELNDELLELRKRECEHKLANHKGHFVTITRTDGYKIKGILKGKTPAYCLIVKNNYGSTWEVDPLKIDDFYGRPDRNSTFSGGAD